MEQPLEAPALSPHEADQVEPAHAEGVTHGRNPRPVEVAAQGLLGDHDAAAGAREPDDEWVGSVAPPASPHELLVPAEDLPGRKLNVGVQRDEEVRLPPGPPAHVVVSFAEFVANDVDGADVPSCDHRLDTGPEGAEDLGRQQVPPAVKQRAGIERVQDHRYAGTCRAASSASRAIWSTLTLRNDAAV